MADDRFDGEDKSIMKLGVPKHCPASPVRAWRSRIGLALMAVFVATTATLARAQLLSERQAHDEIVRAVSEQLAKPDRFTRLPSNISGLSVTPDRKPIFSIVFGGKTEEFKPQAGKQAYLKDEGRFLVTRFGTVVASHKDQVVLQGQLNA